jgi:hypothetical protein
MSVRSRPLYPLSYGGEPECSGRNCELDALLLAPPEHHTPSVSCGDMRTRHHTKDKGDLAVAKVHSDLVDRGATVLLPLTEHAPFDLVAYVDRAFYRVQVKYRSARNGRFTVEFSNSWADRHGSHHQPMPRDEVDAVAIYCPDTTRTYYLNPSNFRSRVNMRLEPTRNGQRLRILQASAFLLFPPAPQTREDLAARSPAEGAA